MVNCNDCIHIGVCFMCDGENRMRQSCIDFIDKSKIIELPCKVGDTVYINAWFGNAVPHKISELQIPFVASCCEDNPDCTTDFYLDQIGKSVFLNEEEAQQSLRRQNEN